MSRRPIAPTPICLATSFGPLPIANTQERGRGICGSPQADGRDAFALTSMDGVIMRIALAFVHHDQRRPAGLFDAMFEDATSPFVQTRLRPKASAATRIWRQLRVRVERARTIGSGW
ncbi:hypothetical protein ATE48_07295 [Candidatus Viadribacter manganicus]|uniref:Uncharacterized protein n=1 Tax=Candidatus Viadribacter manganicus TaxID=1759059 RepID=A0A1B1AGP6_9PROT|nr:hypothetical protein ATE48_07295 [Candidatus Viadribacter manganicus]